MSMIVLLRRVRFDSLPGLVSKVILADIATPPTHRITSVVLFSILGVGLALICIFAFLLIREKIRKNNDE